MLGGILLVASVFIHHSLAGTSLVIPPIRDAGDEVGLIFVPGAETRGEAYAKTARAIQQASELRLWVALTGNYTAECPSPIELPGTLKKAMFDLQKAGMKGNNFVGVGHSLGGVFLASYGPKSPLQAVVLMGAYISRSIKLGEYGKPVLTLSGELDGQTRITRIAIDYEQLQEEAKVSPAALYRTPVINIKGSCHWQFASGPVPAIVRKYDLRPAITDEEAHAMIGKHVSSFVTATLGTKPDKVAEAKRGLVEAFKDSGKRFQPLLNIKALDIDGDRSPWSVMAQGQFAGQLVSRTQINSQVLKNPGFLASKPAIAKTGSSLVVNITALLEYDFNPIDLSTVMESPREVDIKMKSSDAIRQALNRTTAGESETCKAINQLAVQIALTHSTSDSQARYLKYGRPIVLGEDIVYGTGIQWVFKPLQLKEDDQGLHVQSVALYTSITSSLFPGMHYCKVLSPYRAMEWINVDSLRAHKP